MKRFLKTIVAVAATTSVSFAFAHPADNKGSAKEIVMKVIEARKVVGPPVAELEKDYSILGQAVEGKTAGFDRLICKTIIGNKFRGDICNIDVLVYDNPGTLAIEEARYKLAVVYDGKDIYSARLTLNNKPAPTDQPDLVDTVNAAGSFKTLIAAATAAGLVETLKGEGPYTFFAPTDEAFAKLGATVNELLLPENKQKLTQILLNHVVAGVLSTRDIGLLATQPTAQSSLYGELLTFQRKAGRQYVNEARIIDGDIKASNGVIHTIDAVLVP